MKKLLKVKDVASILSVCRSFVYEIKDEIGYVEVGNAIRFTEEQVEAYVARREKKPGEASTPPPKPVPPTRQLRHLSLD